MVMMALIVTPVGGLATAAPAALTEDNVNSVIAHSSHVISLPQTTHEGPLIDLIVAPLHLQSK